MLRRNILFLIKTYPGIDTRYLIWICKLAGIKPQRVCGHLSALKRDGKIHIVTLQPRRCSIAF